MGNDNEQPSRDDILKELFLEVSDGAKINLHLIYKSLLFQAILPKIRSQGDSLGEIQEAVELTNKVAAQLDQSQRQFEVQEEENV